MRKRLAVGVFLVIGAVTLSAQKVLIADSKPPTAPVISAPAVHALQISAGDLLELDVFDTPDLSTKLRVDEQGTVTLPVAGTLPVQGLTAEQAGQAIEACFRQKDVLNDPHVTVTVLEFSTQGVTVLGEVKNPGIYPLLGAHGLLDLISAAGGETMSAGKDVTLTHRGDPDHPQVVKVQSKPGSITTFNIDVRPGDIIMVSHAGIVYVVGDVGKPGGYLIENNDRLTVIEAIALAQGANRTASLNHARLIRKTNGVRQEITIPLKKILNDKAEDALLADGDILYVPGSGPKNALRDLESILPSATSAAIFRAP
jgi:polysaccharide export outer membrane protein